MGQSFKHYRFNSRYYDPEVGRFINADGYVSTGQGLLESNMFAYYGNNPINCSDSNGDCWGLIILDALVVGTMFILSGCGGNILSKTIYDYTTYK